MSNTHKPIKICVEICKGIKIKNRYLWYLFFILAPLVGLEPTTYRLTAERSTN